jgi:hypothetical protein
MPGWRTPCLRFPIEEDLWRHICTYFKKRINIQFYKEKLFLITTTTNLLIKSHQHLNLL